MSNHAAVSVDGGEVGRAQAMQADAANVALERRMNPILLKPSSSATSHLVVLGEEISSTDAHSYGPTAAALKPVVLEAFQGLQADHDWIIAEGAGGAAEINLLERDLVNLPLAHATGMPAILVVDIDHGGAFAAAHGTIDLLPHHLRAQIRGIVFNKFRGDVSLLSEGVSQLEERNGVPVLGVLPYIADHNALGTEDSLDLHTGVRKPTRSPKPVRVAALALPALANPSDLDPFTIEPDVELRWVARPDELVDADIIVLPGSRATVADLAWIRGNGFDRALEQTEAWIVGVCAGYQMLGHRINDTIESDIGSVAGLGLLDSVTTFEMPKIVCRSQGTHGTNPVAGYQIRYGRPTSNDDPLLTLDGFPEGAINPAGTVRATSLHGLFDADELRTQLLVDVAAARDRIYAPACTSFAAELNSYHDHLADWVDEYIDANQLQRIASSALPPSEAPGW